MRHLKSWKIFESIWTPEDFINELRIQLGKYNMSSVEIRDLITRLDIEGAILAGEHPLTFSKNLIQELELDSRGMNGYHRFGIKRPLQSEIRYL